MQKEKVAMAQAGRKSGQAIENEINEQHSIQGQIL